VHSKKFFTFDTFGMRPLEMLGFYGMGPLAFSQVR